MIITITVMVLVAPQGLEPSAEGVDRSPHVVEGPMNYSNHY